MRAQFVRACGSIAELPDASLLELAVAGRSNCGKSSLINALTGHAKLARTSSTPGRTQQLVYFQVHFPRLDPFYLVDLPGYGYARVSKAMRDAWGTLVTHYIERRETLRVLLLLNDARRPPAAEERDLLGWAVSRGIATVVVLTKSDKLNKSGRFAAAEGAKQALGLARRPLTFSLADSRAVATLRRQLTDLLSPDVGATSADR